MKLEEFHFVLLLQLFVPLCGILKRGMGMRLEGKTAVITGASRGIGSEIARLFAREGAKVVVNGRDYESIKEVVNEIKENGGTAIGVAADVTNKAQIDFLVYEALTLDGKIDILVNNAGGSFGPQLIEEITEEDWDNVINLNLKSVFLVSKAIIPVFKKNKYGKIINISSQAGRAVSILANPPYASAKAGVISLTKHLAYELAPYGITANAIAPGIIDSGEKVRNHYNRYAKQVRERILEDIPLHRLGENKEIASAALFLASDESSYLEGATIDINGGRWMI